MSTVISLFADNSKIMRRMETEEDCKAREKDLKRIHIGGKNGKLDLLKKKLKMGKIPKDRRRLIEWKKS